MKKKRRNHRFLRSLNDSLNVNGRFYFKTNYKFYKKIILLFEKSVYILKQFNSF